MDGADQDRLWGPLEDRLKQGSECDGRCTGDIQCFFGKNQFNLAKRLKAAQVHDSDTPSPFSQRLGGGVGSNH